MPCCLKGDKLIRGSVGCGEQDGECGGVKGIRGGGGVCLLISFTFEERGMRMRLQMLQLLKEYERDVG